jgi:hypothetical protein
MQLIGLFPDANRIVTSLPLASAKFLVTLKIYV